MGITCYHMFITVILIAELTICILFLHLVLAWLIPRV